MKLVSTIFTMTLVGAAMAQDTAETKNLIHLGELVKNNPQGDYKFPDASKFLHNGIRGYVHKFAMKLAKKSSDITTYEDVMMQGILQYENQMRDKGFDNDLAASFAFFTLVNMSLAKGSEYQEHLLPNLVSQNRKAFASSWMANLSMSSKQSFYDYMLAESVYLQTLAAMDPQTRSTVNSVGLRQAARWNLQQVFGVEAAKLSVNESGVRIE